jgi:Rap1a immunity proteins
VAAAVAVAVLAVAAADRASNAQANGFRDFGAGLKTPALYFWGSIKTWDRRLGDAVKKWIAIAAVLLIGTAAHAQMDTTSARIYYPSCLAAADIVQGKRPAADSDEMAKQLNRAALCNGAIVAVSSLEPLFKTEFAACPPAGSAVTSSQLVTIITAYLKSHPERLGENFHRVAAAALAANWPCPK